MKFAIVFAAVLAVSSAQKNKPYYNSPLPARVNSVASNDQNAEIIRNDNVINPDNSYSYNVETSNGIQVTAQGTPRDFGGNPSVVPVVSKGTYSFYSPEGQLVQITYVADENGFQPTGDAIPTPHPVPEYIIRSLEYNERNPPKN